MSYAVLLRMIGAESTSSSSTIANGRPTFSWLTCETERDDRFARALIETRIRIGDILALHGDQLAEQDRNFLVVQRPRIRRGKRIAR